MLFTDWSISVDSGGADTDSRVLDAHTFTPANSFMANGPGGNYIAGNGYCPDGQYFCLYGFYVAALPSENFFRLDLGADGLTNLGGPVDLVYNSLFAAGEGVGRYEEFFPDYNSTATTDILSGSVTGSPAVPEPTSLVLFGSGLLGFAGNCWKKLRK